MPVLPVFREKLPILNRVIIITTAFFVAIPEPIRAQNEADQIILLSMQEFSLPLGFSEAPNDIDNFVKNLLTPQGHYPFWQFYREVLPKKKAGPSQMRCKIAGEPKWANGKVLTAGDVRLSFELAEAISEKSGKNLAKNASFELASEGGSFQITNIEDVEGLQRLLEGQFFISQGAEDNLFRRRSSDLKKFMQVTNYSIRPDQAGLYLGPYWVKDFKPGERILFSRHPGPSFTLAPLEVQIVLVPTVNQVKAELMKNVIDRVLPFGLELEQAQELEDWLMRENVNYQMIATRSAIAERILFSKTNRLLEDYDLRLALSLATDRDSINKNLYSGRGFTEDAIDFEGLTSGASNIESRLQLANAILDKLKWLPKSGKIREKGGKRLSLQIATNASSSYRKGALELLKSQWEKIGVELVVSQQPATAFFQGIKRDNFSDLVLLAFDEVDFEMNFADSYAQARPGYFKSKKVSKDLTENLLWLTLLHRPEFTIVKFDSKKNLMLSDLLTSPKDLGGIECSIH